MNKNFPIFQEEEMDGSKGRTYEETFPKTSDPNAGKRRIDLRKARVEMVHDERDGNDALLRREGRGG